MIFNDEKIIEMKKAGYTWAEIAREIGADNSEQVRTYARNQSWYLDIRQENTKNNAKNTVLESDTKTTLKDGSISSSIRKNLNNKKTFTGKELLEIHGFNTDEFQIKTITSNEWSMTNGEGNTYYNFQSKIIAEKKKVEDRTLEVIEKILDQIKPLDIAYKYQETRNGYLLIPLYDIHFGLNTYLDYKDYLLEIIQIAAKGYKEILIVVGGDFLDIDNFANTTEKGTQIETVDFETMIEDAEKFLLSLANECLKNANKVKLTYLKGNHAPSNDYLLVRSISKLLPQLESNIDIEEYKHDYLGEHSIFTHHGDKKNTSQQLLNIIVSKYAKEWGLSKSRYLVTGHLHHEKSLSNAGLTHYQVMSPSKSTSYEKKYGYTTAEKGLMLFEFDEEKRRAVYYL